MMLLSPFQAAHRRMLPALAVWALFLALSPSLAKAQAERAETEQRLRELREQIANNQARISEATEEEQASLALLENLDRQVALREELIRNYERRIRELNLASDSLTKSILALDEDVAELRQQYQHRAAHAYRYGRLHDLALILSAESINQMLIRVRYLNRFAEQRRRKLEAVRTHVETLTAQREALEANRQRNQELLAETEQEEAELQQLKQSREEVIRNLRRQRRTLEQELKEKQIAADQLAVRIRELIAAESSRRLAREAADPNAAAAFAELSGSFLQNRGRLPWPAQGVVVEGFGNRVNPVHGTTTTNPGILISTAPSAEVRAVFEGEVILIDVMPEYGTLLTIAHGEYKSVYSNFSMIYVSQGERVQAGQVLGRAGTEAEAKGQGIFFALFKNGEPIDPTSWLRPQ